MPYRPRPRHTITTIDREVLSAHNEGRVHERYLRISTPEIAHRHFMLDALVLKVKELDNELIDLGNIGRFSFSRERKLERQKQLIELKKEAIQRLLVFFRSDVLSLSSGVYRDLVVEKAVRDLIAFDELGLAKELTFELGSFEKRDELRRLIDEKAS